MVNDSFSRPAQKNHWWLAVVILLVATALRLMAVGHVPPGLYHDEAYNGLDALRVLDGDLSLYFAANNGREPLFIYLIVPAVGLLGRSSVAVRLAAFAPGLLTVAATYALARTLFGRRVGLLSAAVLSVTLWHVHLSRVGFRAVLLPLFVALSTWQSALGWRTGHRRYWLAAGALYGLGFYTYMAARFTPVAVLFFGSYLLLTRPGWRRRQQWTPVVWGGLATVVTLLPLAVFTILHPDLVLGRTDQVAIWNSEIHGGDLWGTLVNHATRTLGMFFVKGDRIWRHNVPLRPVFDFLLGGFFLAGLARALRHVRRNAAMAFIIVWTAIMMLPTLLAEDAPHFLRGVGVLPIAALFPALGMEWLIPRFSGRVSRRLAPILPRLGSRSGAVSVGVASAVVLSVSLVSTATAYFGDYAWAEMPTYWFEQGAEILAGQVNGFLGDGWDGEQMLHGEPEGRHVYIESALWEAWPSVRFLVAGSPSVELLPSDQPWPAVGSGPAAIFLWPYANWERVWAMLNTPAEIRVQQGALSQGDKDPEPYTTYLSFTVTPIETRPPALARFQGGLELVDATTRSVDQGVQLELLWYATARLKDDYTVFVHYLRDGERVAQADGQPAAGHYPTRRWRSGDLVHDDHPVTLPSSPDPSRDQIIVGLYRPEDGQRLALLDGAGNAVGDFVALPVEASGTP